MPRHIPPLPDKSFNHMRKGWIGSTVVCMASGPSLTAEPADLEDVRQAHADGLVRVIAVSNVYELAPWADAVFAADALWWSKHAARARKLAPGAELWTGDNVAASRHQLQRIRMANRPGLGTYQLHTGGNSGYMAINLGFLFGARRFILLGYDMQPAKDGRRHFFGDHPKPLSQRMLFAEWIHRYDQLAKDLKAHGVVVTNCSRSTALKCFTLGALTEALPCRQPG